MPHIRAHIPYRVPLKIPPLQPVMKPTLRKILHTVIDTCDYWPVHLREYIKDALVIVSKRSRKLGQLLATTLTSRFPTAWLESDLTGPCPCRALRDTPGVAWPHGHTFFRDPAVLLTLCQECDTSVFEQNQRNSTVPSWRSFRDSVHTALGELARAVPYHRGHVKDSLSDALLTKCEVFYEALRRSFPKQVYVPHVITHRKLLPPFLSVEHFDKGTEVVNFACVHLRKTMQARTFLRTPRVAEVARLCTTSDAAFVLFWRLADRFALGAPGEYCSFSAIMQRPPLPATRVTALLANYRGHKPRRGTATRIRKHLAAAVSKLLRSHRDALAPCMQNSDLLHPLVPIGKGRNAGVPKVGPQPRARGRGMRREQGAARAKPRGRTKTTRRPELPSPDVTGTKTSEVPAQARDSTLEFETKCLQLLQGVGHVTCPVAPQPPTFAMRKPELCSGLPDVTLLVRYTPCELHTPPVVKCR